MAVKKGYHVGVITGNNAKEYLKRLKQLGVKDVYLNSSIKMNDYLLFMKKHSLDDSVIMYMGDDIPDYNVMKRAGVPVCPADADSEIKQISSYISDKKGGEGCVRDVIEQVLRLNDQWMDSEAFTW
jgi:3-deoxy-D-manno-octulosonate 8-phosphate phosphatase (KDO 8-P phosphatase)